MNIQADDLIQLEQVSCTRELGQPPVMKEIDLRIKEGEWVSIVGCNGSGKSTLVRLLGGLLPISSGRITVAGYHLTPESVPMIRERIGMVFPNPDNQFVGMTVRDDIVFGLENRCLDRASIHVRVIRYTQALGIEDLLDRHPSELSGGQKQKVALAAVLAMEPAILILDETTSMLDEAAKRELLVMLDKLHRSGRYTMIQVTHDHEEMLASDRIVALADGEIIADMPPAAFFREEEVLRRCHIFPPFIVQISQLLQQLDAVQVQYEGTDESGLLEALWESYLRG